MIFPLLIDMLEITFDTILTHDSISRGCRYKCNEFATAMERSFKQRNHNITLEYSVQKATLDIRSRQLGCMFSAIGTMLLTPLELRTLMLSLFSEDLLANQEHIFAHIQAKPKLIKELLINLGLSGIVLSQHFANSLPNIPSIKRELRCNKFQELIETLNLDDHEYKQNWIRIKQNCFNNQVNETKQYRDDGHGGWEEQLEAAATQINGWTTWVSLAKQQEKPDQKHLKFNISSHRQALVHHHIKHRLDRVLLIFVGYKTGF